MNNFLRSSTLIGSYCFISNLIVIEKYGYDKKNELEEIINLPIFSPSFSRKYNHSEVELLALIYHEITHFLDFTTTTWGFEYQFRKSNYIKTKNETQLDVFRLNFIELTMDETHKKIINPRTNLLQNKMEHILLYDNDIGGIIMMIFSSNNKINLTSSINMRCLIESHAYVVEILIKLRCIECEPDVNERTILLIQLQDDFEKFLSNPEFIEYNMLIILAKKHFPELTLKELATFLNILFLRVLDFGMETLGSLANLFDYTYKNKEIGRHISNEIRRGHCRHIVAFKLILLFFEYVKNNEDMLPLLKNNPYHFINHFLNNFSFYYWEDNKHEFFNIFSFFEINDINTFDTKMLFDSIKINRKDYQTLYQMRNISDINLPDIFLNDLSCIKVPSRIDIDISEYSDNPIISFVKKETMKKQKRFHMNNNSVIEFYKQFSSSF